MIGRIVKIIKLIPQKVFQAERNHESINHIWPIWEGKVVQWAHQTSRKGHGCR